MELRVVLVVTAVLGSAVAGPIQMRTNQETCSQTCTDSSKFQFITGKTYEYQYDSEVTTLVQGASEDQAALHMTASVTFEILSKCEITMRLRNVELTEFDPADSTMKAASPDFRTGMQKYPVRLSFQDGNIAELCLTAEEPSWVVNAKRGIVSLIQNNMKDFQTNHTLTETDVAGVCTTDYFVQENSWYTTTIGKTKNLLGCTERHGYNSAVQTVPYTADSEIQSVPLLKSDHNCEHTIDSQSGYLKLAECTEQHMFRPFSSADSGAVTINKQTLEFVTMTTGTRSPDRISHRVSLKFDHNAGTPGVDQSLKDITSKLDDICQKTRSGVQLDTPKLFTDLVYMMKSADWVTLKSVHKMLNEGSMCKENLYRTRQFFLDALPMTGTTGSLQLMTDLISSNVVTGAEAEMWLTTLMFIQKPTPEMLRIVKPLINMDENEGKALLSVGSLLHTYCNYHGNCDSDDMVTAIINAFTNKMAKGCKVTDDTMKHTLMALRGLGNAGFASSAIPELETCMTVKTNPIEIRLSAIEAFRRMPCGSSRNGLMRTLQNDNEDSEVRIAAYQVLMECPSDKILTTVRTLLATEKINQVGSYIWSHLTNLMETSDRHKQVIRGVLEDETFKKEFDLDKYKFSRNYEGSMFVEKLNTGAKVEGDLIWSQKSFIPRSAAVNLTVDLFGHSVNLFEFGGRAEGLEYFLQAFFGPKGYFGKQEAKPESQDETVSNLNMAKINKMDTKMAPDMSELRGSLYMRVFGNELRYMNFHGIEQLLAAPQFNVLEMVLQLAEDNDYTYTHSSMFLDSSIIVPTGSGFPLNLTVNGTSTIDLKLKGKMDLRKPPMINIDGLIQPSAAIDISSMMSVDAFVTKSGIKMVSTLHSSTAIQGTVTIDKSGAFSAQYDMPKQRMDLIDVKSSFFTIHRDVEKEQKMIEENRQETKLCSPDTLATITGLSLCVEAAYPNATMRRDAPFFPMTGPVSGGVYLYKTDAHTSYKMSAQAINNRYKTMLHMMFDTPDSRTDRRMEVDFSLNRDYTLDVSLISPWQKAYMQGAVTATKKLQSITGKLNVVGYTPYSFKAQMTTDVNGNTYIYTPSLEIYGKKGHDITMKGVIRKKGIKQLDASLTIDGFTARPVSAEMTIHNKPNLQGFQGNVQLIKGKPYSLDVTMSTKGYRKKATYKPFVSIRNPDAEVFAFGGSMMVVFDKKVTVDFVLDKVVPKAVSLKGTVRQLARTSKRTLYMVRTDFRSSSVDLKLISQFDKRSDRSLATDIDFTYVIRKFARNNIKFVSKFIDQSSKSLTKKKTSMNFLVKRNPELNFKLIGDLEHNRVHSGLNTDVWYGPNFKDESKHVDLAFIMNHRIRGPMAATIDLSSRFKFPAFGIGTQLKGKHYHDDHNLTSSVMFKYGKGAPITSSLTVVDQTDTFMDVSTEFKLTYPGRDIGILHRFNQVNTANERYTSTLDAHFQRNSRHYIVTLLERKDDKISISSDIQLNGQTPAKVEGKFGFTDEFMLTSMMYSKDERKYSGMMAADYDDVTSRISLGMEKPEFAGTLTLTGKRGATVNSVETDLKWTNGTDEQKNINIFAWLEPDTPGRLNGSVTLKYPSRTLILNTHHTFGSKFISHADFQWEPESKVSADTTFQVDGENFYATANVKTPFMDSPISVDILHNSDSEEFHTKGDINWGETLIIESVIKKPVNLKTIVATFDLSSSVKAIRKVTLFVDHKMSASVASTAKLTWNKQFIQANVVLQNTTKGRKTGFTGTIDLKSSSKMMKKGTLTISHDNNGSVFNTKASLRRNKKLYKLDNVMTHIPRPNSYTNNFKLTLSSPAQRYQTQWQHRYTGSTMDTTFNTNWDKQQVFAKLSANVEDDMRTSLEFTAPLTSGNVVFKHGFDLKKGFMNGNISLQANQENLAFAEIGFKDDFTAYVGVTIPDLDVNSRIQYDLVEEKQLANLTLQVIITPEVTMSLGLSQSLLREDHISHTTITWKSSLPSYEHFKYSYEIMDLENETLRTTTILQFNLEEVIKLETAMKIDERNDDYSTSAILTTPYASLPSMQGGISFLGDPQTFTSNAYLEIQPWLDTTKASLSFDTSNEDLVTSLRLEIPDPDYPVITARLHAKNARDTLEQRFNTSDITIEVTYGPNESVQLEFMTDLSEKLVTSAKVVTPIGLASLSIDGSLETVKTSVALDNMQGRKYGVDAVLDLKDHVASTVTVMLPARRNIVARLSHQGVSSGFSTHAELTHNRKNNFVSDIRLDLTDDFVLSTSAAVKSELIADSYDTSIDVNANKEKFTVNGQYATGSTGKTLIDLSLDTRDDVQGSFVVKSPYFRNIKSSFNHISQPNFLQTKAEVIHGGKTALDTFAMLTTGSSVVGEIRVKSLAMDDLYLMSRLDGEARNFVFRNEYSYGLKKGDAEFVSKIGPSSLQNTLTLTATGSDDVYAEINYFQGNGQLKAFTELDIGHNKHRMDGTIDSKNMLIGTFALSSPMVDPITAGFQFQGDSQDFKTSAELQTNAGKSEVDLGFALSPSSVTSISLRSPYTKDVSARFSLKDTSTDFDVKAVLSVEGQEDFDVNMKLSNWPKPIFSLVITTPIANFSNFETTVTFEQDQQQGQVNIQAGANYLFLDKKSEAKFSFQGNTGTYEHGGSFFNFRSLAGYSVHRQETTATLQFNMDKDIETTLRIQRPSQQDIEAQFTLTNNRLSDIKAHAELTMEDKWEADAAFITSPYQPLHVTISFKPPSHLDSWSVLYDHKGEPEDFTCHAEFALNNVKSSSDIKFVFDDLTASGFVKINSPYMQEIDINFKHGGSLQDWVSHTDMLIGSVRSISDFKLAVSGDTMSTTLTHKCSSMDFSAEFKHEGSMRNFATSATVLLDNSPSSISLQLNTENPADMNGQFQMKSPSYSAVDAKFSEVYSENHYKFTDELTIDGETLYSTSISYSNDKNTVAEVMIIAPVQHSPFISKVTFSPGGNGFKTTGELLIGSDRSSANFSFDFNNRIKSSINIDTPYFPSVSCVLELTPSIALIFKGEAKVYIDKKREALVSATLVPVSNDAIEVTFNVDFPYAKYNDIEGHLKQMKEDSTFMYTATVTGASKQLLDVQLAYDPENSVIDFNYVSKKPHEMTAKYHFSGTQGIKSNWEVTHDSEILAVGEIDLQTESLYLACKSDMNMDLYKSHIDLTVSPAEGVFNSEARWNVADNVWAFTSSFQSQPSMEYKFSIVIPDRDMISGQLMTSWRFARSVSHVEFIWNDTTKYEYDMKLRYRNGYSALVSVYTPVTGYEQSQFKASTTDSLSEFDARVKFAGEVASIDAKVSNGRGEVNIQTPFEYLENNKLTFYQTGDISDFKAGATLDYGVGEAAELAIEHELQEGTSSRCMLRFVSPYTEQITFNMNNGGSWESYTNNVELSMGTGNTISSVAEFGTRLNSLTIGYTLSGELGGESFENRAQLKHNGGIKNFQTQALLKSMANKISMDTTFQLEPVMEGSILIETPFKAYEDIKLAFTHSGNSNNIYTTAEVQYATKKKISGKVELIPLGWRHFMASAEVTTPFEGLETSRISYRHTGSDDRMQCEGEMEILGEQLKADLKASVTPLSLVANLNTPIEGFETLGVNTNLVASSSGSYSALFQTNWNQYSKIEIDGTLSLTPLDGSLSVSTPFESLRSGSVEVSHQAVSKGYREAVKVMRNREVIVDIDLDHSLMGDHKNALLTIRAPKTMSYEIDGDVTLKCVDLDLTLNWNLDDRRNNMKVKAGYDVRTDFTTEFKVTHPGTIWSFDALLRGKYSKANVIWGRRSTNKAGYELTFDNNDLNLKVILPSRSLQLTSSQNSGTTSGSFLWDADVDTQKKIGFTSKKTITADSVKMGLSIEMPSIAKNVQVSSELIVYKGSVIFEGRTEVKYSRDTKKNIVITSKLEDVSVAGTTNYSFSMGVSQPSTTVGVQLTSHAGQSASGYSAGLGLDYLTTKRETKTFMINGRIDKIKKSVNFQLESPVKVIDITGSVNMNNKFQLDLVNVYDRKQALKTVLILDPATPAIYFTMNYDLENARDELQMRAVYVNSTAVRAEVYRVTGGARVDDALFTTRLNNSHLLHSRIHWRPELWHDIKVYYEDQAHSYKARSVESRSQFRSAVLQEMALKSVNLFEALREEIGDDNAYKLIELVEQIVNKAAGYYVSIRQLYTDTSVPYGYGSLPVMVETPAAVSMAIPAVTQGRQWSFDTETLRKNVSDNFQLVYEKLHMPSNNLPGVVRHVYDSATDNIIYSMPESMAPVARRWRMSGEIEAVSRFLLHQTEQDVEDALRLLEKVVLSYMKSPFTVYDPAHGEIQLEAHLLLPVYTLRSLPVVDGIRAIERLGRLIPDSMPSIDLPDISAEIIPPFTGVATISKGQRITTYDGYIYDLDSDCTYILSRDFQDKNFTVILSNDGDRTLTILTSGKPVSINIQEEVLVGGLPVTLPFIMGDLKVTQDDNGIITIDGGDHFTIEYDTTIDHITVKINGWYFGKTAGLLGVYDNEPTNDLMTSFNKVVDNPVRFARTWTVGSSSCS